MKGEMWKWSEIATVDETGALVDGNGGQSITVGTVGLSTRAGKLAISFGKRS